jgi:hypothetical protein
MKPRPDADDAPADPSPSEPNPEVDALDPDRPFGGPPRFRRRGMPLSEILAPRICYMPPRTCRDCRHLGPPVYVRTPRGDRRVRRVCLQCPKGYSAPDWPACDSYQPLSADSPPLTRETIPESSSDATNGPKD